jgi:hypothetical protein
MNDYGSKLEKSLWVILFVASSVMFVWAYFRGWAMRDLVFYGILSILFSLEVSDQQTWELIKLRTSRKKRV